MDSGLRAEQVVAVGIIQEGDWEDGESWHGWCDCESSTSWSGKIEQKLLS